MHTERLNSRVPASRRRTAAAVLCSLSLLYLLVAEASAIRIRGVNLALSTEGVYTLTATVDFELSQETLEALDNGVPLDFIIRTRVQAVRPVIWNTTVASRERHLQIQYHALSKQYVVRNVTYNTQENYLTRTAAVAALSQMHRLWLIDRDSLKAGTTYLAGLRVELDYEELPSPMRPWVWFSSDWDLDSGWQSWPLQ